MEIPMGPHTTIIFDAYDEEEGAYTWQFFSKKYAKLFNHIFDNNKEGNQNYLGKIEQAGSAESINLEYTSNESDSWIASEKSFIDSWNIGTYSGDKIAQSVFDKIQQAGNDEEIASINLSSNRIYIGSFSVEEKNYPVAIYASKGAVSDLKKITVTDSETLEETDRIKYIYCDETFTKYLIIAFFKEGADKSDPSLIMQIEKFAGDDTKDKWLEHLGILTTPIEKDYEMKLYEGEEEVNEGNVFTINTTPEMPDIRAGIVCSGEDLKLRLKIEYNIDKTYNGQQLHVREDVSWYPNTDWHDVNSGDIWDVDFGTTFRGGTGYLIFKQKQNIVDTLVFYIRGPNPTEQEVHNYVNTLQDADGWYVPKMIRQESSFRQFNNGTPSATNNSAGMPNWGPPYGWGMKQLDNIGSTYGYLTAFNNRYGPSPDELWNWQANVRKGIEFFNGAKLSVANTRWNNALNQLAAWEEEFPELSQDSYSMIIIDSPDASEENTTVTEIVAGNNTNNETFVASNAPEAGQRTLRDAFACKYYNGGADYFILVIPVIEGNNQESPPELPYWEIDKEGSTGRDYVEDISGRAGW